MGWITNPSDSVPDQPGLPSPAALGLGFLPVAGQIYDTYQRSKDQKREIDARKAEAELAYQRQIEMWHLQNQYNSPAEQMKRFGAAGLNPYLVYSQGNAGNASGTPSYQPPHLQYRGVSPPYGGAIASVLPTLMAVGTWMQNMRLSEMDIRSKETNIGKAEQLVEFLQEKYPREIRRLDAELSNVPYQTTERRARAEIANAKMAELLEEFRWKYGSDLEPMHGDYTPAQGDGGYRRQQFLKLLYETKLKGAQASWTDYNVTNPQSLIQMVLGGALAMAGMTIRGRTMSNVRRPKITETETIKRVGRTRTTKTERYMDR